MSKNFSLHRYFKATTLQVTYCIVSSYVNCKCGEVSVGLVFSKRELIYKNDSLFSLLCGIHEQEASVHQFVHDVIT